MDQFGKHCFRFLKLSGQAVWGHVGDELFPSIQFRLDCFDVFGMSSKFVPMYIHFLRNNS